MYFHSKEINRHFVSVDTSFDRVGTMIPRAIIWDDNRRFDIDQVLDFRPADVYVPGLSGQAYEVVIGGNVRLLFFDRARPPLDDCRLGRWWVNSPL